MRTYTEEEKLSAKRDLPAPLSVFFDSPELATSFVNLEKTLHLNLRQTATTLEVVSLTFLGLEPEARFEANIRGLLPELSKEETEALISYVNKNIFMEAKRRLLETQRKNDPT